VQAALNAINEKISQANERLAAAPVNSPQQSQALSILRALDNEAGPYRTQLASLNALDVDNIGKVVTPANRPGSPASPRPTTNALLGAFFGCSAGLLSDLRRARVAARLRSR